MPSTDQASISSPDKERATTGGGASAYENGALHVVQAFLAIFAFFTYRLYAEYGTPVKWFHMFFVDDTFYYIKIAENFVRHGFFTFDGINRTNGFQPLWMAVLVLIKFAIGDGDLVVATLYVCMILHCCNSILLAQLVRRTTGKASWAIAAQLLFLGNILLLRANLLMMENTLALTLALLVFLRIQKGQFLSTTPSIKVCLENGALLALFVLCRVDYAIVVGLFFMLLAYKRRQLLTREIFTIFAPPSVSMIALGCINMVYFGRADLISGYVKHHLYVADYLSGKHGIDLLSVYGRACLNFFAVTNRFLTFQTFYEYVRQHQSMVLWSIVSMPALSIVVYHFAPNTSSARGSWRMPLILNPPNLSVRYVSMF